MPYLASYIRGFDRILTPSTERDRSSLSSLIFRLTLSIVILAKSSSPLGLTADLSIRRSFLLTSAKPI